MDFELISLICSIMAYLIGFVLLFALLRRDDPHKVKELASDHLMDLLDKKYMLGNVNKNTWCVVRIEDDSDGDDDEDEYLFYYVRNDVSLCVARGTNKKCIFRYSEVAKFKLLGGRFSTLLWKEDDVQTKECERWIEHESERIKILEQLVQQGILRHSPINQFFISTVQTHLEKEMEKKQKDITMVTMATMATTTGDLPKSEPETKSNPEIEIEEQKVEESRIISEDMYEKWCRLTKDLRVNMKNVNLGLEIKALAPVISLVLVSTQNDNDDDDDHDEYCDYDYYYYGNNDKDKDKDKKDKKKKNLLYPYNLILKGVSKKGFIGVSNQGKMKIISVNESNLFTPTELIDLVEKIKSHPIFSQDDGVLIDK